MISEIEQGRFNPQEDPNSANDGTVFLTNPQLQEILQRQIQAVHDEYRKLLNNISEVQKTKTPSKRWRRIASIFSYGKKAKDQDLTPQKKDREIYSPTLSSVEKTSINKSQRQNQKGGLLLTAGMLIGIGTTTAVGGILLDRSITNEQLSHPTLGNQTTYNYSPGKSEEVLWEATIVKEIHNFLNPTPTATSTPPPPPTSTPSLTFTPWPEFCGSGNIKPGDICKVPPPPPPTPTPIPSCSRMDKLSTGAWCIWPSPTPLPNSNE
jgi:hypothetical protein